MGGGGGRTRENTSHCCVGWRGKHFGFEGTAARVHAMLLALNFEPPSSLCFADLRKW